MEYLGLMLLHDVSVHVVIIRNFPLGPVWWFLGMWWVLWTSVEQILLLREPDTHPSVYSKVHGNYSGRSPSPAITQTLMCTHTNSGSMQSPKAKWSSVVVAKGTTVHFQAGGRAAWTPKFANVITQKKVKKWSWQWSWTHCQCSRTIPG